MSYAPPHVPGIVLISGATGDFGSAFARRFAGSPPNLGGDFLMSLTSA